jgi:hypothetical protein
MRPLLIALFVCAPLSAQVLDWGVKGGVPFNDAVKAAGTFNSNFSRWTLGPVVELNLPAGLGLEFDALYRRTGYSISGAYNSGSIEFPLLVKYKFPGTLARMYVDGGFVFRHIGDIPLLQDANSKGFVFGAGFRYDLKLIKISPELRYTRWDNQPFNVPSLTSARNQTEFLIGITF